MQPRLRYGANPRSNMKLVNRRRTTTRAPVSHFGSPSRGLNGLLCRPLGLLHNLARRALGSGVTFNDAVAHPGPCAYRRAMRASTGALIVSLFVLIGCGGAQSADDIARGIDDAVRATKPKPLSELPQVNPTPELQAVPEEQTEAAARRAVCRALEAYSSDPATSLSAYINEYAQRQRVLADYSLNEIDPDEADRLAAAASDIEDTQQAAEVAAELGCA